MLTLNFSKNFVGDPREKKLLLECICNFRRQKQIFKRTFFINQWRSFKRWQEVEHHNKEYFEWKYRMENFIKLDGKYYLTPERSQDVMPKKAIQDQDQWMLGTFPTQYHIAMKQLRYVDHSFDNLRRCKDYRRFQYLQFDQRFMPERLLFLGPDLAAAHFIVHRNGSVKFMEDPNWYKREGRLRRYFLPGKKVDGMYVEAIDASGTELMFEGFDNLYDLEFLRLLSLKDCRYVDDWVLSRIGGMFSSSLEMLDLSNCKRISAKGLVALRSLTKLRFLRLDGLENIEGIEKSALMLEDAIPDLVITGLDYDKALSQLEEEEKLLRHDRTVLDAKGNAFVEDDNGRFFYVKGSVNERVAVCDQDKPLVTSVIRRELPAMDTEEFEDLDDLAKGKLRHFLVGSPSGYSWTEQVETILTHEEGWRHWEGIPTEIKMLPKYKRVALLEARRQNKLLNNGELMLELTKDSEQQEQIEGGEMDKQQQQIVCG
uniref:ATP synthase subunit s-like protein n=2 Tax=Meloidogyne incognita TaxID=6306 RepID=A0A914LL85_MELIC